MASSLLGRRFGKLRVLSVNGAFAQCVCDCGVQRKVWRCNLSGGNTTSCGCSRNKRGSDGLSGHPLYWIWVGMLDRCYEKTHSSYKDYGGRGIRVCERWRKSCRAFIEDVGPRPAGLTLDRVNNEGNYEPDNCRWATREEQNNNTRKNTVLRMRGRSQTVAQWSREFGIEPAVFYSRRKLGWPTDRCFSASPYKPLYKAHGRNLPLVEWAKILGISYSTLHARIHVFGWPISKALTGQKRINQHK
jgi:hypothetical protein